MSIKMPLNIRSEEVNQLARRRNFNETQAVETALETSLRQLVERLPLWERIKPIRDRILARPATGMKADKAFCDCLNDEEDA